MSNSRILNAKRNMIWTFVNKIVSLLLPFLTRTAIIYYLGTLYLGLNSLFSSVLNILSLAELGFGTAMVFSMSEPIAKGDADFICALLKLYRKIYTIIGTIILAVGLILMLFLPFMISGETPGDVNIYVLYCVYLGNTVLSYFMFAYKESILTASQRTDITSNIATIISVFSNLVQLLSLFLFKNYYAYCIVLPIATIIKNCVTSYIVDKKYPQYKCYGIIEREKINDIKKRVAGLFIYRICNVFRDSFDSIILSAFLGLTVLAKYNNYYYILTAITGFLSVIKTSIAASVGNSIATESEEKNYQDFQKCQLLYMWASGWCTVCLFCLYQPFVEWWIGEEYLFSNQLMALFCVYFFCYKMGDICAVYRQAAGLWWQDRFRPVVESVTNLVLNIVLVKFIGVAGVMLSTICCLVFINAIWASNVLYKYYFKNHKQLIYIGKIGYYALITTVATVVTGFMCSLIPLTGILALIIYGIICSIVPNGIFVIGFCKMPEFQDGIKLLKNMLKYKCK